MEQVGARPRDRLVALEETLEALRALLRGEAVSREGRHVRLDGVHLEFAPAQAPPLLAGITGPRGIAVAGRAADGLVLPELSSPAFVRAARERLGQADPRVVVYALLALDDDPAVARDAVRPVLAGWLESVERPHQLAPLGVSAQDVRALPDALVAELAVAGDAAACAAAIRALGEAGATSVALMALPGREEEQLARVGREVLPLL
jgi:alkanesulfonate monooxygenase SsuD/methylene tetrahydromethanopterin reductase-like flavin-dependent oxidoreductase (luciferase family)